MGIKIEISNICRHILNPKLMGVLTSNLSMLFSDDYIKRIFIYKVDILSISL